MKRRFYALMLVVAMLAMTLVGCGSDTTDTTNTTNEPNIETNTEVDEPVEDVVTDVPTEEPIETPSVDEPTEDVVVEDGEDDPFIDDYTLVFPEGMTGETEKFVFANDETWSLNYTHYVSNDGNEMNFVWEGPTTLGEQAISDEKTLALLSKDKDYQLCAWYGGELELEELDDCLTYGEDFWLSLAGNDVTHEENSYYNIERVENKVYVTYAITTNTMKGYAYYICNGDEGNYYMFRYLENIEIYDDTRATNVIHSISYWEEYSNELTNN